MRAGRGFTLIELLVVIAIIAILAAILFPVFARAREKARETTCLSNVKEISLGLIMYLSDYDSRFPKRSYQVAGTPGCSGKHFWPRVVAPYIGTGDGASSSGKDLWRCPSYRELVQNWYCGAYADYALNGYIEGLVDSEIPYPAATVLIGEYAYWHPTGLRWYGWYSWAGWRAYDYDGHVSGCRYDHNDRQNIGFCDGHAKGGSEQTFRGAEAAGAVRRAP